MVEEPRNSKRQELETIIEELIGQYDKGQEIKARFNLAIVQTQISFEQNELLNRIATCLESVRHVGLKTRTK